MGRSADAMGARAANFGSTRKAREDFEYLLEFIISNGTGDIWEFLDFCVPPVVARLRKTVL